MTDIEHDPCLLSKPTKIFFAELLLSHAATCTGCEEEQCVGFKKIIKHTETCQVVGAKCPWCPTMHAFFNSHAKMCTNVQNGWSCSVPFCARYKALFAAKAKEQETERLKQLSGTATTSNETKRAKVSDEIEADAGGKYRDA